MLLPPLNQPLSWKTTDAATLALLDDLQANILKGHGRDHAAHVFLSFDASRADDIKAAIHQLSGELSSARQQLERAESFKSTGKDGGTVRCFFLTAAGYRVLGVSDRAPKPDAAAGVPAFEDGMSHRTDLGDDPKLWDDTFRHEIHAMLLLADRDPVRLTDEAGSVVASLGAIGVTVVGQEIGDQQRNARGDGVEHFGYVDGRSQPLLLAEDVETEAHDLDGVSMWDPAFPLEQVLVVGGTADARAILGSYFVFRKLEQNVKGFKAAEAALADDLKLPPADRDLAGAMMVGRFEDGTPAVLRKHDGMGGDVPNNFNYDDDPAAAKCPFHAHIRKTNPRGSGGFEPHAAERRHLMARRGITYGTREAGMKDEPEGGVGLLFMAYQSSLENQFEFTQKNWANNPGFPRVPLGQPQPGIDPVIGQGTNPPGTQHMPLDWGNRAAGTRSANFSGFVTMRGGEYFFAPVISTLRTL